MKRIKKLLCVAMLLPACMASADINLPVLPTGIGERCVEPTELMRKNHMDYLTHQRDLTVHSGIRSSRHSLVGCVQCHAQQDDREQFIPIDAGGQFCQSCHAFAGVAVDCFECHASQPDGGFDGEGHAQKTALHWQTRQ